MSELASPLASIQRRLWRLIAWPEGVEAALREDAGPDAPLESVVASDERLGAVARLDVYANAYFYRIHDVLAEHYPTLARALGEPGFHDLVTSYLAVHPSEHPSLRWIGGRLPAFLASDESVASLRVRCPFAADLAALEWASEAAFDAADAAVATRDELARIPAEDWGALPLRLHPSARLLRLEWPVQELRKACRDEGPLPEIAREATAICVWRRDEQVVHRVLEAAESRALERAAGSAEGIAFGALCEEIAREAGEDEAPMRAASWLARWTTDGLIRAL